MNRSPAEFEDGKTRRRAMSFVLALLGSLVLLFGAIRLSVDLHFISTGTLPDPESFELRYVIIPWLAYGHIVPAMVFLAIAPFQLWRTFRKRRRTLHRRMGRLAVVAAVTGGLCGTVFGSLLAFGGTAESIASLVFGLYFMLAVVLGYRSIRRTDTRAHRRWMIRASSIALAAGTIRVWVGLLALAGIELRDAFALAFWLGFSLHAMAAEIWLWWRPEARGFRLPHGERVEDQRPTAQGSATAQ